MMKLYSYWRSSSAYRVRIALNLKGVAYDIAPVNLIRGGGEQRAAAYLSVNPQGKVPALSLDDGGLLTQSLAIIEYLEERWPEPALLPGDAVARARCRAFAQVIACDIQPLQNLTPLGYIRDTLGADDDAVKAWASTWIANGFTALERDAGTRGGGPFLFGDEPGLAEAFLVPQMYNARRFGLDISEYPTLATADAAARVLPAFAAAAPGNQPDAPGD